MATEPADRLLEQIAALKDRIQQLETEAEQHRIAATTLSNEIERLNRVLDQIPTDIRTGYETLAARAYVQPYWSCGRRTHLHATRAEAETCAAAVYFPPREEAGDATGSTGEAIKP